jgi:3-hydroxybutyrate dehydrogenase
MSKLAGKTAIVTGAASGIGRQIALALSQAGAAVAIADLNRDGVSALAEEIRRSGRKAIGVAMDVTDEHAVNEGIDKVAAAFGSVDVLVSNAGIQIVNPIESYALSDWKKMQAIHVDGAFLTTKAALKHMYKDDRGGVVIYMGSVDSHEASPLKSAYVAAKHALLGLARVLAKEGAAHNVRSHVVCPDFVRAPLVDKQLPEQAKELAISEEEVVRRVMLGATMDGVFTTVEDVGQTVLFLAALPSAALTGQSSIVSHGWFMQ